MDESSLTSDGKGTPKGPAADKKMPQFKSMREA